MTDRRESTQSVDLPEHVVERIENRLPATKYETVDEYVTAALDGLLRELPAASTELETDDSHDEDVDSDAVEERLNSLGYL